MKNSSSAVDAVRAAQKRAAHIAIEAEAKVSKLFEEAEREARLFFEKRGSLALVPFFLQISCLPHLYFLRQLLGAFLISSR